MSSVESLAELVRASRGFAHKRDIADVVATLGVGAQDAIAVGDDAAAIPDGDGYLLFAIEGFVPDFIAADPWFAGYCGVMVNVSDIAAMGGEPIAVVDALWSDGEAKGAAVLAGLRDGAARYGVPVAGGHSNLRSASGQLAVAILGRARRLITSFDAMPGDALVVATDLRGRFRDPFPWWDASSATDGARLRGDLAILPALANDGLVLSGKDISMAGIVGTALMMLESSGCGATIDIARLPKPADMPIERWLTAFPSFGFVMSVAPRAVEETIARFRSRGIACSVVGSVDKSPRVDITNGMDCATVWDVRTPFINCAAAPRIVSREACLA